MFKNSISIEMIGLRSSSNIVQYPPMPGDSAFPTEADWSGSEGQGDPSTGVRGFDGRGPTETCPDPVYTPTIMIG